MKIKIKNNKSDKNKYLEYDLTGEEITKFIINKDYKDSIIKYIKNNKIKTKFIYNSIFKNFLYFVCKKRLEYKGMTKIYKE